MAARVDELGRAPPDAQGAFGECARAGRGGSPEFAHHGVDGVFPVPFQPVEPGDGHGSPIDDQRLDPLAPRPLGRFGVESLAGFHQRRQQAHPPRARGAFDARGDGRHALAFDRGAAGRAMLHAQLGEEQAQEVIHLRHRRHGRFAASARDALFDRDAGRHALDPVDLGRFHLPDVLAGVETHAVEETPLALGEKNVKSEGGFS